MILYSGAADNLYPVLVQVFFFKKMGQSRPLFVYFRSFLITISIIQVEKSVDGVLGIRTRIQSRMVGADETTELWRPPPRTLFLLKAILKEGWAFIGVHRVIHRYII